MDTSTLQATLTALPAFAGRVIVATDLASAVEAVKPWAAMPCCVIHGLAERASANQMGVGGGPRHAVTVILRLLIAHRDVTDPHGFNAMTGIEAARTEVKAALLGIIPETNYNPLEYRTGQLAYAQAGTVMWLDEWSTEYLLARTY